jgi:hypothetical protein
MNMRLVLQLNQLLAGAFVLLTCVSGLEAQDGTGMVPDLFEPTALEPQRAMELEPYIVESRPALICLDLLATLSPQAKVHLNLFKDLSFVGVVERVTWRSHMRFTVAGHLEEDPHGTFIIVVEKDVAAASIRVPSLSRVFDLRYIADGVYLICEIDTERLPSCGSGVPRGEHYEPKPWANGVEGAGTPPGSSESASPRGACPPPAPVIDVLLVYTNRAREAAGGNNAIRAGCQIAIEDANKAYTHSLINARLRLVYTGEIQYEPPLEESMAQQLDKLIDPADDEMDEVHDLRDDYGADLVTLVVFTPGTPGLAKFCPADASEAFTLIRWENTGGFAFAHETGHNLGCDHDRQNSSSICEHDTTPYSYGWRWTGDSGYQWHTVMAYQPGDVRWFFSNPDVFHDGQPTGVPIGEENEAHNAQTINLRAPIVENFRPEDPSRSTLFDIWVDFSYPLPLEYGTWDKPYNTVSEGILNTIATSTSAWPAEPPTLWIKEGSTSETPMFDKRMLVRVCGGPVIIGAQ